jgi:hypothetical protein
VSGFSGLTTLATGSGKTGTTLVLPAVSADAAVGDWVFVLIGCDNFGSGSGQEIASITDTKGNTYSSWDAFSSSLAQQAGAEVNMWYSPLTTALVSGVDQITITGKISGAARAAVALKVTPSGVGVANRRQNGGTTGSTTFPATGNAAAIPSDQYFFLYAGAMETATSLAATTNNSWATYANSAVTSGGGAAANMAVYVSAAILTTTTGRATSWVSNASGDNAVLFAVFEEYYTGPQGTANITEVGNTTTAAGTLTPISIGTANITEAPDTATGAGTVVNTAQGTATVTEAPDTATAAGTLSAPVGTATITEAANTLTSDADLVASGTAGITEAANTTTADGTAASPAIIGTATVTEAPDTTTAAGTVALGNQGNTNVTEVADTTTAAGVLSAPVGTATITEAANTTTTDADVVAGGAGTVTEAANTTTTDADVVAGGASTVTEAPDTATAAGTVVLAIQGVATVTEAPDVVTGAGTLSAPVGTANITEAANTLTASGGLAAIIGTASVTEAADTLFPATAAITEAAYPNYFQAPGGAQNDIDKTELERAVSGYARGVVDYPVVKNQFYLIHTELTMLQKSDLDIFWKAHKSGAFDFTWAGDGQTYRVRFARAPQFAWSRAVMKVDASVVLEEA